MNRQPTRFFNSLRVPLATLIASLIGINTYAADPWADRVESYTMGEGVTDDFYSATPYSNPAVALGEPTRFTSTLPETAPDEFGGVVTPLNSPFRNSEIVSIGRGGSLTVAFDEPVEDDPLNPFGIDLLVFGNAFFFGTFFNPDSSVNPDGVAEGVASEGGEISVSADGVDFFPVLGAADGLFPTNGYDDVMVPFTIEPGVNPSDYTRPVNPAFDPLGKTFAEIVTGYGGSGGGLGVDISGTGLSTIFFVRVVNPAGSIDIPEIDAFADVRAIPEPPATALAGAAIFLFPLLGKTARGGKV